jgi:nucleoside phosphorylase/CheY-like chemotaxis protein
MLSILLVEDDPVKLRIVKQAILEIPDIKVENIEIANDKRNAKRLLYSTQFDLMILDLSLPERFGDHPENTGGVDFLEEIDLDEDFILPFHIIGLTAYPELMISFTEEFTKRLWHLITYDIIYSRWKLQLQNYLKYLIKSKAELSNPSNVKYNFDIAIITALYKTELENVLKLDANWVEFRVANDHTIYYKGYFKGKSRSISVVAASADQMGLTATSTICQKLIQNFRPRYLAMTGIAAGVRGKGNYGDVMVADITWDYGSGKIVTEVDGALKFKQDPRPIMLSPEIKALMLKEEANSSITNLIENKWAIGNGPRIENKLRMIIGPIASGSYVLENIKKVQEVVDQQRKLIGIDMESYAVFYAATFSSSPQPKPIVIKSICDFGDENKNDNFQNYAAFTSANFFYQFALKYL